MQDDENTKNTGRHNIRVENTLWDKAQAKARVLTLGGYVPSDAQHMGATSVNAVVRMALIAFLAETEQQSIKRLKLISREDAL